MTKRLALLGSLIALALALVASAQASPAERTGGGAGSFEAQDSQGTVVMVVARGALYGHFARGRLTVTDRRAPAEITVWGEEEMLEVDEWTTVYRGRNVYFSVTGGTWRAGIAATGLDASFVGRAVVTLRGEAGTVSLDSGPFRPWPSEFRTFQLGG